MIGRIRFVLLLSLAAGALAGCGGSGGIGFVPAPVADGADQNAVRQVIVSYAHALAVGDGATLCALLDSTTEQQIAQLSGAGALAANAEPANACAQTIAQTSARLTDAQRNALNTVAVKAVVVEGDVATVTDSQLTAAGASTPSDSSSGSVVLVRQGPRWLISQVG